MAVGNATEFEEDAMATTYRVSGMSCQGCVNAVTNAIKAIAPAAEVGVDLEAGHVTVEGFDDETALRRVIDEAGFTFGGTAA